MSDEKAELGQVPVSDEMIEAGLHQHDLCIEEQTSLEERMVRIYQTMEQQRRFDTPD